MKTLGEGYGGVLELVDGDILVFDDALVLLVVLGGLGDLVGRRAAPLLLDVRRETQRLSPATRIEALVAPVLEFRLLRVVTAMIEFAADEL